MKIQFNLRNLLTDKRIEVDEIAFILSCHPDTIYKIIKRKTVKPSFLRLLEKHFGDCSQYIIKESVEA